MNFLIFKDFSIFFLNFYEINSICFELNSLKYIFISCADVIGDLAQTKNGATT